MRCEARMRTVAVWPSRLQTVQHTTLKRFGYQMDEYTELVGNKDSGRIPDNICWPRGSFKAQGSRSTGGLYDVLPESE